MDLPQLQSLQYLYVWFVLPIAPAMNQFPEILWTREGSHVFHFNLARPVSRLNLTQDGIRRANADDIPSAQTGRSAGTPITGRFQKANRPMFVARTLGLGIHVFSNG